MAQGHVRQRGTSLEIRVHAGNRRYVTRTVRWQGSKKATKDAADRLLRQLLDELDVGGHAGPDATFAQLVARWRRHAEADWSPTTRAAYDSYLRTHLLPAFGARKIVDLRPGDFDDLYAEMRAKGSSPATIGKAHVIARRALAEAVRWRWITLNPAEDARPPKIVRGELSPPSPAQVRQLLDACGPALRAFLTVSADTGARRGEVCALRWTDVDLEAGELVIARAIAHDGKKLAEKDTKTHQARRVSLGAPCVATLKEHRLRVLETALAAGRPLAPDAFLFSADPACRTAWRPDGVTTRFGRARAKVGLEAFRLHDLRHFVVSTWLSDGVDSRTVMGRVGHASLQTLTRYAHFQPSNDREAAQRIGDRHSL